MRGANTTAVRRARATAIVGGMLISRQEGSGTEGVGGGLGLGLGLRGGLGGGILAAVLPAHELGEAGIIHLEIGIEVDTGEVGTADDADIGVVGGAGAGFLRLSDAGDGPTFLVPAGEFAVEGAVLGEDFPLAGSQGQGQEKAGEEGGFHHTHDQCVFLY
jgi:hypothetical protein